ncbi:MAG: hypothetical protein IJP29_00715 [Lachnospiraceae bacterium]|nr:hypothetical protein [Lachnospiraceae bacterium]
MKKLWRQEWKYHLFFVLFAMLAVIFGIIYEGGGNAYTSETRVEVFTLEALWGMDVFLGNALYILFKNVPVIILIVLLLKKAFIYWLEKERCGREFFQSLPVTRAERVWFHFAVDVLTIVFAVAIGAVTSIEQVKEQLAGLSDIFTVEIPWLVKAYAGIGITVVAYCVMVLCLLYLMEQIFVNGCLKVVGFLGCILMVAIVLTKLWHTYYDISWVSALYGFFALEAVGGNYMMPTYGSSLDSYIWVHNSNNPPFLINGETVDCSRVGYTEILDGEYSDIMNVFSRFYDFTKLGNYMGQVAICLGIGIILFVIALHLAKKKDLSREGLYFDKTKYPIALALAMTMYVMLLDKYLFWYQHLLNILTAVIVFVFLCYMLSSNRRPVFAKKDRNS